MIKTILFDIDNTILDFSKAERLALSRVFQEIRVPFTDYTQHTYSEINKKYWEKLERKEITRCQVAIGRFVETFEVLNISESAEKVNSLYCKYLADGAYFMPNAQKMLESLHNSYKLYLVSNGTKSIQKSRLSASGIADYFEGVYISEDIGFEKPDIHFFEKCNFGVEFDKTKAIIIGDSLTSDIKGGNNFGIKTCWYNPNKKSLPKESNIKVDYVISDLQEIKPLLDIVL